MKFVLLVTLTILDVTSHEWTSSYMLVPYHNADLVLSRMAYHKFNLRQVGAIRIGRRAQFTNHRYLWTLKIYIDM